MTATGQSIGLKLTPRPKLHPNNNATRPAQEEKAPLLALKTVIGTTTACANAFDSLPEQDTFVYCAGPAAILSQANADLEITQRLFRARPHVTPINATPSFYNTSTPPTSPAKSRHGSPLKESSFGVQLSASSEYAPDSPNISKIYNRVREATCVSIGRSAKFLAVGETGYNPRILLFSTEVDAPPDVPLSILTDHSFGVQSVAFSADSRWLCSLGNSYDGFLLLYSVSTKTGKLRLHSSNKCSNVHTIVWMGSNVISIGTRHVKVWRVERANASTRPAKTRSDLRDSNAATPGSPSPRIFSGRNCILGPLIDANFTGVVAISESQAILCTAQGDICLLDDTGKSQRLDKVGLLSFGIQSISYDDRAGLVWFGGDEGKIEAITMKALLQTTNELIAQISPPKLSPPLESASRTDPSILVIGCVGSLLVTIDSDRLVEIRRNDQKQSHGRLSNSKQLHGHESAVLGICDLVYRPHHDSPEFLTYSARGSMLLWRFDGACSGRIDVPIEQPTTTQDVDLNELKTVVVSDFDELLFAGDKVGLLRVIDRSGRCIMQAHAHSGDISGLAVARTTNRYLVASCGRDRTLQLFRKDDSELCLLQTLDDHAAAVGDIRFVDNATTLLSISSDRTVIVRKIARDEGEGLAFILTRVINLKASPVSFTIVPFEPDVLVVSTIDRQIQRYEVSTGRLLHSFKPLDPPNNDTVQINSLEVHGFGDATDHKRILVGVSSTDRSIRLHDYDTGSLLAREHCQSAVSAVKLMQVKETDKLFHYLISCGLDGTIIIYTVSWAQQQQVNGLATPSRGEAPLKQTPASSKPPRRVLSRFELSEFQKTLENGNVDVMTPLRSPSPSRMRRKTSRYSLANTNTPRTPGPGYNTAVESSARRSMPDQIPTPTPTSLKSQNDSRSKRPTLDNRRRSKSAANLNDLDDSAEQICKSLRTFRKRVASSVADKLKSDTARELELELELALNALRESRQTEPEQTTQEAIPSDLLDSYLAKMIDERLALKARAEQTPGARETPLKNIKSDH